MDSQLRGQVTDGVMPLYLIELVRGGHSILRYGYIVLDQEGKLVGREKDVRRAQFGKNRGVAIEFQTSDGRIGQFYYLSLNLENRHLLENAAFQRYLASLDSATTMLKATSYMPHLERFSIIREQILRLSSVIVQDDSGIPFRLLDPAQWSVRLYGDYEHPIQSFGWLLQPELREAYQDKSKVGRLPFPIGYGSSRMPSNLQVARRKD
jgi:hypothetical protein